MGSCAAGNLHCNLLFRSLCHLPGGDRMEGQISSEGLCLCISKLAAGVIVENHTSFTDDDSIFFEKDGCCRTAVFLKRGSRGIKTAP